MSKDGKTIQEATFVANKHNLNLILMTDKDFKTMSDAIWDYLELVGDEYLSSKEKRWILKVEKFYWMMQDKMGRSIK